MGGGMFHKGVVALGLVLSVPACNDVPRARSEAEIRRIAAADAAPELSRMTDRIDALERKLTETQHELSTVRRLALSTSDAHDSLVKTFNGNVKIENEAAARDMTRRGRCGTERVDYPNGGVAWRNRECTVKDLPR